LNSPLSETGPSAECMSVIFRSNLPGFRKNYLNDEGDGWYAGDNHELKYVVADTWNIELEIEFHRIAEKLQEIGHTKTQKSSRKVHKGGCDRDKIESKYRKAVKNVFIEIMHNEVSRLKFRALWIVIVFV
jgi:hypothetical protein